jgi:hypothetical protein
VIVGEVFRPLHAIGEGRPSGAWMNSIGAEERARRMCRDVVFPARVLGCCRVGDLAATVKLVGDALSDLVGRESNTTEGADSVKRSCEDDGVN